MRNINFESCTKKGRVTDQVGPFASLKFSKDKKNQFETRLKILGNNKIIYDESENTDEKYKVYSNLKSLIIPLPNSIKVSFGDIYNEITLINNTIETILDGEFIWDIYLTTSNLYKIEVLNEISHSDTKEIPLLFYCLPKYIWVAKVYISQCLTFDFIYDPSDINFKNSPYMRNVYSENFKESLRQPGYEKLYKLLIGDQEEGMASFLNFIRQDD